MATDNKAPKTNGKPTRRAILNAGVTALASAGAASPFLQQPQERVRSATGPNRTTTSDERFTTPAEPANAPMGVGKGVHPGRVVWAHDPKATGWDGQTGNWWEDANTDSRAVEAMFSGALQSLAGEKTDKQAWKALFSHFNQTRKQGSAGYRPGEKIAIKINSNQDRPGAWRFGAGMPSPHAVYALVYQLITVAGVPGQDITLYDASRYIGDPIVSRIRANPDPHFQAVQFAVSRRMAGGGRVAAIADKANPIHFSKQGLPEAYPPSCVTEAKYLINQALFRAHTLYGVTLCGKNHYGSISFDGVVFSPQRLHDHGSRDLAMGSYNCLVDLIGHKHLGGKTLLYMVDGLYPAAHNEGRTIRFVSFGNHWASSLFLSQDPVAIDSVGLDFLRNEPSADECRGNPENYLHEAALAGKPPSGTVYNPTLDAPLDSLGVHEHWNNATEKKYSRNLGKREGIELVTWPKARKT